MHDLAEWAKVKAECLWEEMEGTQADSSPSTPEGLGRKQDDVAGGFYRKVSMSVS